ncbi:MBL fold metallo-hydrolase [Patescibacteria group bacterium]|nr:MBL fold metallo-hydrolase [Patescibacteria group bacterium]
MTHASPNAVLIEDNGKKILVDPGSNKKQLVKALEKKNLKPDDIDAIFITHWHPDHILNIRLFPEVIIFDIDEAFHGDEIKQHHGRILDTNIEIISTPGHDINHASLLVDTDKGAIAIAGDVFWWEDKEKQETDLQDLIAHKDEYVENMTELCVSRKKLLKLADYIIPGHGKMFSVKKGL